MELGVTSLKEACNLGCEFTRECLLPTQQVRAELHPGSPPTHTPVLPRHPVHTSAAAVPSIQGPLHSCLYPPECSFYEPQCLQDTTQGRAPTSVEWGEGKNASVFGEMTGSYCEGVQPQRNDLIAHPDFIEFPVSLRLTCTYLPTVGSHM